MSHVPLNGCHGSLRSGNMSPTEGIMQLSRSSASSMSCHPVIWPGTRERSNNFFLALWKLGEMEKSHKTAQRLMRQPLLAGAHFPESMKNPAPLTSCQRAPFPKREQVIKWLSHLQVGRWKREAARRGGEPLTGKYNFPRSNPQIVYILLARAGSHGHF